MNDFNDNYYESSDGLQLFYRDYQSVDGGARAPVICLPGLTRNSLDFNDLALLLSRQRRVITPDLRGRGRSEYGPDRNHYNPAQYVVDIWRLLDQLDISEVVVIGTSLGGLMAMRMAYERPAAISAAVINDIGPEIDPVGIERVVGAAGTSPVVASWEDAVANVKKLYSHAYPNWSESNWREHTRKTYVRVDDGRFDIRLDRDVGIAAREGVSGLNHDPWQLFDALRPIPLLVIRGEISDIFSADTLQEMKRHKPNLTAVVVKNRGHAPNLDEPEAIDAIEKFLENN